MLGRVHGSACDLTTAGRIAETVWRRLPDRWPHLTVEPFRVMPNHMHGVLQWYTDDPASPPEVASALPTLGQVMRAFKGASARIIGQAGPSGFAWQRGYYEHVIRTPKALNAITAYIEANPLLWSVDRENPDRFPASSAQIAHALAQHGPLADEELELLTKHIL